MARTLLAQRLVAVFVAGALLLDFPLLGLFDLSGSVAGIPVLPLALFVVWALVIAVAAWLVDDGHAWLVGRSQQADLDE